MTFAPPEIWEAFATIDDPIPVQVAPSAVFVVLASHMRVMAVRSNVADQPVQGGRAAIFARVATETEQQPHADIVGVFTSEQNALKAVEEHRARHPNLGAEYTTSRFEVDPQPVKETFAGSACVGGCGTVLMDGRSYCRPCQERQWANSGWVPTGKDEE